MPTTLPVPSKGALRALRGLALGTSCTIAICAGLLTEDRRRRIRAAREVHDNAKKLKSSRKYHSAGTTALETFEDHVLRYREDAFWLPSNVLKSTVPKVVTGKLIKDACELRDHSMTRTTNRKDLRISRQPSAIQGQKSSFGPLSTTERFPKVSGDNHSDPPKISKSTLHNLHGKLATDLTKLLQCPENIDEAASRFFEAFKEGLFIDGMGIPLRLMEAAIELRNAAEAQKKFEISDKVFDIILGLGTLHEEHFYSFQPAAVIRRLITRQTSDDSIMDLQKLRKACSIFLTKFKEKPKSLPKAMQFLGERLCAETCRFGLYDLTLDIHFRIQSGRGSGPSSTIAPLIIAMHGKGHHRRVFRYFLNFYTQTKPDQLEFYKVGGLTIESILSTHRSVKTDNAEQALIAASRMAEENGLFTSTTWFLKVLGDDWRTHRDLERTRSLFERLKPFIHLAQHPQGFYGAMIQFCIEADEEPLAQDFYDTMKKAYPPGSWNARISGHFAFAKAKLDDWLGVKDDFSKMKRDAREPQDDQIISSSFAPILKLYVQTHTISDSEEFLCCFIDELGINLTTNLSNIMVEAYAKTKEIESLARWIDHASASGCSFNSVTYNNILKECSQTWEIPFWDIFHLHKTVRHLSPELPNFVNGDTVQVLRGIAISARSPSQEELARRMRALKTLDGKSPKIVDDNTVLRAMAITFAKEDPVATLKLYKRAQKDQVRLESKHLLLAVKASLQLHPNNAEETLRYVQDAQKLGVDVSKVISTIIVHQMTAMYEAGHRDGKEITELAQKTVTTLEKCGMRISPTMVTHAASILEKQGHCRLAIDVLESLFLRIDFQPVSFNLVTLTVLLKAYIGLRDHVGIKWVVKTLAANRLYPDERFLLYLTNARRSASDLLSSGYYSDNMSQFLDALSEALETTRLLREEGREEREEVKYKVIEIIKKAIADQAAEKGLSSHFLEPSEKGNEDSVGRPSNGLAVAVVEPWVLEEPQERCCEMKLPVVPILVEVGAG